MAINNKQPAHTAAVYKGCPEFIPICAKRAVRWPIATDKGLTSSKKQSSARYYSFQCQIIDNTETVTITTLEEGKAILKKVFIGPAPST